MLIGKFLIRLGRQEKKVAVYTTAPVLPGLARSLDFRIAPEVGKTVGLRPNIDSQAVVVATVSDIQPIADSQWRCKVLPKYRARLKCAVEEGGVAEVALERAAGGRVS
jgi:hypothetical protein